MVDPQTEAKIVALCSDCHVLPKPENFPQEAWHDEVQRGYGFYLESGRSDLKLPPQQDVIAWFRARAPEALNVEPAVYATSPALVRFAPRQLDPSTATQPPCIAAIRFTPLRPGGDPVLVMCDMRSGEVRRLDSDNLDTGGEGIAKLNNPCHAEPVDLDKDGLIDLVVADLGSFDASDHDRGRVVWLRQKEDGTWETHVLADSLGRVAAVRPGDFDGDGLTDLIVAVFGWHATGGILLLKQASTDERPGALPRFEKQVLDSRPGASHLEVDDIDGDGRLDFFVLISQHYETVEAFLHREDGFEHKVVWTADDPAYGLNGIQLCDLDGDGDRDLLLVNGDAFDGKYVKPYHGLAWLENRGTFPYEHHRLADMPGVCGARAGDLDGDGDLDIAAAAFLPHGLFSQSADERLDSVLWLEQVEPGTFVRRSLEKGHFSHAALEIADLDGDGIQDLAVGWYNDTEEKEGSRLTLWRSERSGSED